MGRRREQQHRYRRDNEHEYPLRHGHVNQQQFGVKDEQERQRSCAKRIEERDHTCLDRIATRNGSRRKTGKAHGGRHIGHDPKVEHKEVHSDQRHDQSVLLAKRHDDWGKQCGNDDIVRRRRQAHPKDQRQNRRQEQDRKQVTARQDLDHICQRRTNTCLAHGTHDNTRGRRGDTDTDHVARTCFQTINKVFETEVKGGTNRALPAHNRS